MPRLIFRHPQTGRDLPSVLRDSYAAASMRAAGWSWREEAEAKPMATPAAAELVEAKPRRRHTSEDS